MQVTCSYCSRVLEFTGDPPLFCAYCGRPLYEGARMQETGAYQPGLPWGQNSPGSGSDAPETEFVPQRPRGYVANLPAPAPDPEQVAGYKIIRVLGRGGMGSVYEAEDSAIGRRVALKLISPEYVTSPEAVERFRQEGRMASAITHPRCVFVLGADEHLGRPYIVMELMPGQTLQALVENGGPLPVGEAIARILDVIDGLREAHLLGVIHRDVKPSNCFLDGEGRVKVGDFGLSKSLDRDSGLTRTGAFVGTPLYASPEQIKRDAVDERTDVYSVAATLYYLLTGRPPFEAGDAAATLAKIVSEDPTPPREWRPDLPPALEAALLRGLQRDRDYRWPDLERFREALLPFVSLPLRLSDLTLRVSAFFVDTFFLWLVRAAVFGIVAVEGTALLRVSGVAWAMVVWRILWIAYFTVLEGVWGASIGKRLTGLRVSGAPGTGPPGPGKALLRAGLFYLLTGLPDDATTLGLFPILAPRRAAWLLIEPLSLVAGLLGCLCACLPMRARNGFRGVHEWASDTRVTRLPSSRRRRVPRGRRPAARPTFDRAAPPAPGGLLKGVGPFRVAGAVVWDGRRRVLLGEDPSLNRPVWLVMRPKGSPAPTASRRDLGRHARPRWLSGGEQGDFRWDAYSPQLGCPLADLAGPDGLPWADVRPILHDLAEELARAMVDGTLPDALSVEQVWVQPDGSVQLVDPVEPSAPSPGLSKPTADARRALELLAHTAALALEGGRRRGATTVPPTAIHAPVPEHATRMLDRLIGRPREGDSPYRDVASVVADLEADRDKPTEVDAARRAAHLGPSIVSSLPLLTITFGLTSPYSAPWLLPWWVLLGLPFLGACWAAALRGGLLMGLTGLALVRSDSRPAERWRCAWRAFLVWTPVSILLATSAWASTTSPARPYLGWGAWGLALALVASYPLIALIRPSRSFHDQLSGTWLVPK